MSSVCYYWLHYLLCCVYHRHDMVSLCYACRYDTDGADDVLVRYDILSYDANEYKAIILYSITSFL